MINHKRAGVSETYAKAEARAGGPKPQTLHLAWEAGVHGITSITTVEIY